MGLRLGVLGGLLAASLVLTGPICAAAKEKPAPLPPLPSINVTYSKFVLKNGLTLIVNEDHKAPIVAVNIWYHVGSKNEPAGRTGFAHLFEHLMFGGRNGTQSGWFEKMETIGATDLNGTTSYDRTNFFETVPTAALDMTLYLEAQRMGHLLDSFNEQVLTTQRGVVQNEKRQHDTQPYSIADDIITKSVWPASHPYSHTVIGEMADLDAAKIDDVKDWFGKYYGPANAVISIAGDITPEQAKAKVETYFGALPPGPPVARQKEWIAKRAGEQRAVAEDHVTLARLYKVWNVPGGGDPDDDYLTLLAGIMSWGKDSRLYKRLVYTDKIAADVSANDEGREIAGLFQVQVTAKPGIGLDRIEKAVNEELARLLKDGPTAEEVDRAKTRIVSGLIRRLERVGGFGGTSDIGASSEIYLGSPDAWKESLQRLRTATPAQITAVARRWLSDGDFTLEIKPFPAYTAATAPAPTVQPEPGAMKAPGFVKFERAQLKNGLKVVVAERHDIPLVTFQMLFDAGFAAGGKPGTASLAAANIMNGTPSMDAIALSDRMGELGITLGAGSGADFSAVSMSSFTTRLDPALDLFADVTLHPAYRPQDVAREKALAVANLQRTKDNPTSAAIRLLPELIYGAGHPYSATPTEADINALTPEDLHRYHDTWFQPEGTTLIVVGDTTLKDILPKIEARFDAWAPVKTPVKSVGPAQTISKPVIYLINKPNTPQSVILAAKSAPPKVNPEELAIQALNRTLGGAFSSRLNMNLREAKHWSYGSYSFMWEARGPGIFLSYASVQSDKTADSLSEMRKEISEIATTRPVTPAELTLTQNDMSRSLPGRWETTQGVAGSVSETVAFGLPDDYYATYAARIRALTTDEVNHAAHSVLQSGAITWMVVGDRAKIEPGLKALGMEVRVIDTDGKPVP